MLPGDVSTDDRAELQPVFYVAPLPETATCSDHLLWQKRICNQPYGTVTLCSCGLSAVGCVLLAQLHSQAFARRSMPSWVVVVPAALLLAGAEDVVVDCHWTHGCAHCGTSLHAHCMCDTHSASGVSLVKGAADQCMGYGATRLACA